MTAATFHKQSSNIHCAVFIRNVENLGALERSLDSVLLQECNFSVEIIIVLSQENSLGEAIQRWLTTRPWIFHSKVVEVGNGSFDYTNLLSLSNADWFLQLESGDTLSTNALARLIIGASEHRCAIALGALRHHNRNSVWSAEGIDNYFASPGQLTAPAGMILQSWNGIAIAAINRAGLLSVDEPDEVPVHALHEYVARRRVTGKTASRNYQRRHKGYGFASDLTPGKMAASIAQPVERVSGNWLFGERGGEAAEDNAWALFKHCVANCPQLECYYVLNEGARRCVPREFDARILVKGSPQWKQQLEQTSHFLFTDSAADILDDATQVSSYQGSHFIFLTHGYLAYSPGVYLAHHQYIDHVICTSHADIRSASEWWGFSPSKFLPTGLPRWDLLAQGFPSSAKEILLCPTWRKVFSSLSWSDSEELSESDIERFRGSHYFQALSQLLGSDVLAAILEEHNLSLSVNIHFRLRKYLTLFPVLNSSRIRLSLESDNRPLSQMLQDACALITDYSSIMWDMAYMQKPVLCYQFDKAEMLWERNLEQFALPDEQLLAEVCYSQYELLQALTGLAAADFDLGDACRARVSDYLPHPPGENCARSLEAIIAATQPASPGAPDLPCASTAINSMMAPLSVQFAHQPPGADSAVLFGTITELPAGCTPLRSDTWRDQIEAGAFKQLFIEPHLDARNEWATTFFSPRAAHQLIQEISDSAKLRGIPVTLSLPRQIPYAEQLARNFHDKVSVLRSADHSLDNNSIDISVIIPVFNGEAHIGGCIQSVLDQDFKGTVEVVVVDDGSTDGTADLVRQYASEHAHFQLLRQENARQGMARNRGLFAASGKYITFLDADDLLTAHALQRLWDTIMLHRTRIAVGLVASCTTTANSQRVNQAYFHYSKAPDTFDSNSWPQVFYDPSCVGKLYERQFLLQNAIFFPQSFHEDQVFCFKLFSLNERLAVTRNIVYFYVARADDAAPSGTQIFSVEKLRQILLAGSLAAELLNNAPMEARVRQHALGFLVMRYDRFLWKQSQTPTDAAGKQHLQPALEILGRFLAPIDSELIARHARHVWAALLLVKAGQLQLAQQALGGNGDAGLDFLHSNALLPRPLEELCDAGASPRSGYNYYKSVPVVDHTDAVVTDMSYGYRLGYLFVESVKSPLKILAAPVHALILIYDMVSGRGLEKQKTAEARLRRGSKKALARHSEFIKLTASYQVGVAVMEAFTRGPRHLLNLPARIKAIYRRTRLR